MPDTSLVEAQIKLYYCTTVLNCIIIGNQFCLGYNNKIVNK